MYYLGAKIAIICGFTIMGAIFFCLPVFCLFTFQSVILQEKRASLNIKRKIILPYQEYLQYLHPKTETMPLFDNHKATSAPPSVGHMPSHVAARAGRRMPCVCASACRRTRHAAWQRHTARADGNRQTAINKIHSINLLWHNS